MKKIGKKLKSLDQLKIILPKNKKLIVTTGAFDLPHKGHRIYTRKAREQGDILVLILHSDDLISLRKGPSRPIRKETTRVRRFLGKAYKSVDYIFVAKSQNNVYEAIRILNPTILVTSITTEDVENCPTTMIKLFGKQMEVVVFPAQSETHSTDIIKRRNLKKSV
jgi:cytidyltransferase-like protein